MNKKLKNEFVSYDTALYLKGIGFNKPSFAMFYEHNKEFELTIRPLELQGKDIAAPLYQQVFDWFEEEHNLSSHIKNLTPYSDSNLYQVWVEDCFLLEEFESRLEAKKACVEFLIKTLKECE